MDYNEGFEKIKGIICENFSVDSEDIIPETNLFEDLNADSLDLVDLISAVEYEFDIEAPEEAFEKVATVDDVVRCVADIKNSSQS